VGTLIEVVNSKDGRKYFGSVVELRKVISYVSNFFDKKERQQVLVTVEAASDQPSFYYRLFGT
jgi:hypothetical protein